MQKGTAYKPLLFAAAGIFVVALVAFFAFWQTIKWVGHTDLEVCFVVTDSETGQPIPNAAVHISAEPGGFCDDATQSEFTITTDQSGHAKHIATNCMCFGSKSTFEDTFGSHLPRWSFHATATGYFATGQGYLGVHENANRVQRGDPFATLSIQIRLQKNAR